MATIFSDTCARADQSGFGTSSDSQTYTITGASVTTAIVSNEAKFTSETGFSYALAGSNTTADINFLGRFESDTTGQGIGPAFRYADVNNQYFVAIFSSQLSLYKIVSGSLTNIANFSISGYNATSYYWVRTVMAGNHIQSRVWLDGNSEPGTWGIDTTDASFSSAGRFGVVVNGGNQPCRFDHLTITDNSSVTTNTRTIPSTAALLATNTRTIPSTAALLQTGSRTIPSTAALQATNTRTIPCTAALIATQQRTVPSTAALLQTNQRTIPSTSALLQTSNRSIPSTAALIATNTRSIPSNAALLQTSTRTIPCTASLGLVRTIPCAAALLATNRRTIPCTAALSGTTTSNATFYVRGGQSAFYVRGGEATFYIR